jgi:ATP-dependent Lon protease
MATALVSLLTGRMVRNDLAMTGEVTLRGQVLPVGGIKEKVLAAHRAGLKTIILPSRNEKDLEDLPQEVRNSMKFILVEKVDQVFEAALTTAGKPAKDNSVIGTLRAGRNGRVAKKPTARRKPLKKK